MSVHDTPIYDALAAETGFTLPTGVERFRLAMDRATAAFRGFNVTLASNDFVTYNETVTLP